MQCRDHLCIIYDVSITLSNLVLQQNSTLKKMEVDLAQEESLQLQSLSRYHLPLLPQCRVTAFVYSKFQILVQST